MGPIDEIKLSWEAAQNASEFAGFAILERLIDRLGYGRIEGNPSLVAGIENALLPAEEVARLLRDTWQAARDAGSKKKAFDLFGAMIKGLTENEWRVRFIKHEEVDHSKAQRVVRD